MFLTDEDHYPVPKNADNLNQEQQHAALVRIATADLQHRLKDLVGKHIDDATPHIERAMRSCLAYSLGSPVSVDIQADTGGIIVKFDLAFDYTLQQLPEHDGKLTVNKEASETEAPAPDDMK
jgi:hypothetical protein